ncbi:hypothetical protein TGP89_421150 [Toxoplasma gondii p89]|uniref:Uncharacterized protein n=1 Tax=Toxoplasma gondii p89 TaxID=943119 RepID=A0A086JAC3_TOXGO|nr:hypothetical protein TGP89_421150 [Toxoplasma gondii p89]
MQHRESLTDLHISRVVERRLCSLACRAAASPALLHGRERSGKSQRKDKGRNQEHRHAREEQERREERDNSELGGKGKAGDRGETEKRQRRENEATERSGDWTVLTKSRRDS